MNINEANVTASPLNTPLTAFLSSQKTTSAGDGKVKDSSDQLSFNGTNLFTVPTTLTLKKNAETKRARSTASNDLSIVDQNITKKKRKSLKTIT